MLAWECRAILVGQGNGLPRLERLLFPSGAPLRGDGPKHTGTGCFGDRVVMSPPNIQPLPPQSLFSPLVEPKEELTPGPKAPLPPLAASALLHVQSICPTEKPGGNPMLR